MNLIQAIETATAIVYQEKIPQSVPGLPAPNYGQRQSSFVDDVIWKGIFNQVIDALARTANLDAVLQREYDISIGSNGFDIPEDWATIISVVSPSSVYFIRSSEMAEQEGVEQWMSYAIAQRGNKLIALGMSDSAPVECRLLVQLSHYLRENTDELPFGERWHYLICQWAAYDALMTYRKEAAVVGQLGAIIQEGRENFRLIMSKTKAPMKWNNKTFESKMRKY